MSTENRPIKEKKCFSCGKPMRKNKHGWFCEHIEEGVVCEC
jgi:hypothetical protein